MTIDTIFLCFCEDCERNDGLMRPYFMSRGLMEFVQKSKNLLEIQEYRPGHGAWSTNEVTPEHRQAQKRYFPGWEVETHTAVYIYMIKWRALLTRLVRFWWEYSSSSWFMFILYFQAYKMTSGSDRRQSVQSYKDYACRKTVHIKQLMFQQSSQIHRYICNHFGFLVFSVFPASIKFCVLVYERIITEYNYIIKWIIIKKNKSIAISTAYDFLSTLKMRKSWWWSNENQPKFTATINIKSSPFLYNLKVLFLLFVKINLGQPIICSFFVVYAACYLHVYVWKMIKHKMTRSMAHHINTESAFHSDWWMSMTRSNTYTAPLTRPARAKLCFVKKLKSISTDDVDRNKTDRRTQLYNKRYLHSISPSPLDIWHIQ